MEVKYRNENYISISWVNTCKYVDSNKQMKSQLAARSFEESDSSVVTDSPACSKESLRLTFTLYGIVENSFSRHFSFISPRKIY